MNKMFRSSVLQEFPVLSLKTGDSTETDSSVGQYMY